VNCVQIEKLGDESSGGEKNGSPWRAAEAPWEDTLKGRDACSHNRTVWTTCNDCSFYSSKAARGSSSEMV
jgi:hypothetical protein